MEYQVLIAEDEEVTRNAIVEGLKRRLPGARFYPVKNGVEAVDVAKRQPLKLAFLDIRMPEMNGITAAQKIHEIQGQCQFVFLTAYNDFSYVHSALKLDAVDYLLKPFDQEMLSEAVEKVMRRLEESGGAAKAPGLASGQRVRWLTGAELGQILGGKADPADLPAGTCGIAAAIREPEGGQMQRLRHILTGLDFEGEIRCLCGQTGPALFLIAWGLEEAALREQAERQLRLLEARLRRQFHFQLRCGIGGVFFDEGDLPEACLDAFGQLMLGDESDPVRTSGRAMQGELLDPLVDTVLPACGGDAGFCVDVLKAYLEMADESRDGERLMSELRRRIAGMEREKRL